MHRNCPERTKQTLTKMLACLFMGLFSYGCGKDDDQTGQILAALLLAQSSSSPTCATTGHCKMFVADNVSTNTGISGLDNACANSSNKPSGGTYKALVVDGTNRIACTTANCSGGTSEHIDWVLKPNKEYRRTDGSTVIGTTNSNGIFSFPISNGVDEYNSGTFSITVSALESNWTSSTDDCTNFSLTSGDYGTSNFSETDTTFIDWATSSCTGSALHVVCVEQ